MPTVAMFQSILDDLAADFVKRLSLRINAIDDDAVTLTMPVGADLVHGGGVLCGQAILAAADTAMLVAMIARLDGFKPMTTVQLQASFLRAVPQGSAPLRVVARVLRLGKTLSYGEVEFIAADDRIAAHATTTYSLL
jgi:uncharacterized protein (TIGR00369 family)